MDKHTYIPPYVWPAKAFPFRLYFDSPRLRIFLIESLRNNWEWLLKYHEKILKTDVFFVISGWHHSETTAKDCREIIQMLNLDLENFFFLAGSLEEHNNFNKYGLNNEIMPHNAWLDSVDIMRPVSTEKLYDAIYVGRRTSFKRHMLARDIDNLAIVAGINHGNQLSPVPYAKYINENPLSASEVSLKINQSFCGLILSDVEGGCFASSEYLMCGIPVVSTYSKGGRDFWYNEYNSIVVEPNTYKIKEAVNYFINNRRSPEIISKLHHNLSDSVRLKFIQKLEKVFCKFRLPGVDAYSYFYENFFHKMRKSIEPDFEEIFGDKKIVEEIKLNKSSVNEISLKENLKKDFKSNMKTEVKKIFKPCYKWPNKTFPFSFYLDHPKLRIFIIENLFHNWDWLSVCANQIKENDFFFVYIGWFHDKGLINHSNELFKALGLNKNQFFIMYNSHEEKKNFEKFGFIGDLINHNCWLDWDSTMKISNQNKIYDAIYVARRTIFKRHLLASKVKNLALISGNNHGNDISPIPNYTYLNPKQLSPTEVCNKINQSFCGLILSETEGACFASSEYLLCGIPVVSTKSNGGRDIWYDDYNSIVTPPKEEDISDAVKFFCNNPRDPLKIRNKHIELAKEQRNKFINVLKYLFEKFNIKDISHLEYYEKNYIHKLRGGSHIDKVIEIFKYK